MNLANAVRVVELIGFTTLAIFLPGAIQTRNSKDSVPLALMFWAILAGLLAAIAHRWSQPLYVDVNVLRFVVIGLGLTYVVRARRTRRARRRKGDSC